ncbi:esterase/lipase family protein [Sporosarcina sp. A2]|uniref:esterase/lipase family protein n=1 Tax=Sporosarcina sp. A2 TaxID=3393449 RepID=UPI003D7BE479
MDQVLLLHGFNKSSKDMMSLANNLESLGFRCHSISLPLTRHEFDRATKRVLDELENLAETYDGTIHLVGHSTGGLLVRHVLKESKATRRIGRCVQIATPNQGSQLAVLASYVKGYTEWFRTLKSLNASYIHKLALTNETQIELGAIAGTNSNLWLGRFIHGENDGRVELSSVTISELTDFTTLPYGHKDIHHHYETAVLTSRFLNTGSFQ